MVRRFFLVNGWTEAASEEKADCVILFTCAEMRYKVVNMTKEVERLSGRIAPNSELIVGSCLPKTNKEALAKVFQGRTITPTDFSALNALPDITIKIEDMPPIFGRNAAFEPFDERRPRGGGDITALSRLSHWASGFVHRHFPIPGSQDMAARLARTRRMVIYVSAGCAKNCSYCAIRFATGQVRSKPLDLVMQNISEGLRLGYGAFDLLSDSIGGYGLDLGTSLGELFDRVLAHPGQFTVAISDLHPQELIRYFGKILSLCQAGRIHYLYVPVQSGNERILRMMNRPCDVKDLTNKLMAIRSFGGVFLRTGIMVGFPGETEAEFEESLVFLKTIGFDDVFVHYYCDMPNTHSSTLPGKLDKATMAERLNKVNRSGIRYCVEATRHEWESNLVIS
ncbi:MAG: radical SAM protein [Acidobacteria bacterium]|nr:radical SAM protein [Acidobacteriota bacterium]